VCWDWDWLYYMGTNLLKMSEKEFWRCTPRKLFALWNVHKKVNGLDTKTTKKEENKEVFIDQLGIF
jgi:hypothetical protein